MRRRVVITGMGAVSSLGMSARATMDAMAGGLSGITALEFRDVERLQIRIGGQIKGYDEAAHFFATRAFAL